ncbi:hypothetical protein ACQVP2_33050 [Methylobacterium aquaticum]|jgi:hypothetical protein|uniref:Uncharacterized protein n=1 Tax=Methylobacterium aquaticum TaxID=270351 RepID=A0A0J6SM77_9HYPH|nr:hypothetical protein [Methylobacterium aquaticum]KMO36320.1 hypothetical protein VP06_10080 [Methylobacterium aquaticum]
MTTGLGVEPRDFAAKLQLTAAVLGCQSQKSLAARFRQINPRTEFDVARSYKWTQGRTLPRSAALFDDWARLLNLGRSTQELLTADLDTFRDWLAERYGQVPAAVRGTRARREADGLPLVVPRIDERPLEGHYACFSHAQSPYYRGRLIRSSLTIEPPDDPGEPAMAHYTQTAPSFGVARLSGPVRMYGQTPCLAMHTVSASLAPIFVTLFRPTRPVSVLTGIMSSFTVVDPDNQPPYATRFVAVRIPPQAGHRLEAGNRYLEAGASPASELAALGLAVAAAPDLDRRVAEYLDTGGWAGSLKGSADASGWLTIACDRVWLATCEHLAVEEPAL